MGGRSLLPPAKMEITGKRYDTPSFWCGECMVGGRNLLPPIKMEITGKRYDTPSFWCGECMVGGRSLLPPVKMEITNKQLGYLFFPVWRVYGGRLRPPTIHSPHSQPGAAGAKEEQ
ncbi:hypothetical protein KDK_68080 [Dictyobacter kobayashii]|uniref:Uncharacterized protein n=1 Tax=Dictyobacter kobayashii TaxID=2014872 RepID=A0A402AV64_9CHLR|nr:hypothetical protein KDK_68080 [Dictyobacter kobayashii]